MSTLASWRRPPAGQKSSRPSISLRNPQAQSVRGSLSENHMSICLQLKICGAAPPRGTLFSTCVLDQWWCAHILMAQQLLSSDVWPRSEGCVQRKWRKVWQGWQLCSRRISHPPVHARCTQVGSRWWSSLGPCLWRIQPAFLAGENTPCQPAERDPPGGNRRISN